MTLSYLVSTAGHAQRQNEHYPHTIESILQLVYEGAQELGDEPVVGFTSLRDDSWVCDHCSFRQLLALATALERDLIAAGLENRAGHDEPQQTVSMLCPTGLHFLVSWLALMRMGYGVVLVAPQCSPSAIASLLQSSKSSHLIYHPRYTDLAQGTAALSSETQLQLPDLSTTPEPYTPTPSPTYSPHHLSHIFHTSGTSGTPKPIPYKHISSASPLPRRSLPLYIRPESDGGAHSESAAFTTTPIFHGGVSDLLRAWMARSVVYFYPTSEVAITAANVVAAVQACTAPPPDRQLDKEEAEERADRYRVTAFLSVPYILTILAEDQAGMGMMKQMELVSTGGAPLDPGVGAKMVKEGVRLVSRLGSSECGFLLSSYRDFPTDDGWDWLHNDSPYASALVFEPVSDGSGKCEMVVTEKWRSKNKSNREDGSYATGDLYLPHPTKPNVWRYMGRGDEVIVMNNGEKASPAPIETIIRSSPHVAEALVAGPNRDQLGLLVFLKPDATLSRADMDDLLAEANAASPSFAQISADMCFFIPSTNGKSLPKSSKGTVQRGMAYDVFKEDIERLYSGGAQQEAPKRTIEEIEQLLNKAILDVAPPRNGEKLGRDTDLFNWGVNSLMATRLRNTLQKGFYMNGKKLPGNIVFEKPTIARLSRYLFGIQQGTSEETEDVLTIMRALADKYGSFALPAKHTVLLTGATGSLGVFLLHHLLQRDEVEKVICLVRAPDNAAAEARVKEAMEKRGLISDERVQAYAAVLGKAYLGLQADVYLQIQSTVSLIIHAAWPVHFASSLSSFEESIQGTRNLIDLAHRTPHARFLFCSSLASVLAKPPADNIIREVLSKDPSTASGIGYSQSKWVAENICAAAQASGMNGRVGILRVGQLCGDTMTGYWNEKEGWPLLIRTAKRTGCLPLLTEKPIWLPVDQAARTIIDIAFDLNPLKEVYHVVHPHETEWSFILDALENAGLDFQRVSAEEWLRCVEQSYETGDADGGSSMLGMWRTAYGGPLQHCETPVINTANARAASTTLDGLPVLSAEHIGKMVVAWQKTGFI